MFMMYFTIYIDMRFIEVEKTRYGWLNRLLPGVTRIFEDKIIIVAKAETEKIYLISKEMYHIYKKMEKHPYALGFFFAEVDGDNVKFSLGTADKYAKFKRKAVVVNKFGEEKFLYKRNIMKKHILRFTQDIHQDDLVVVVNKNWEALGFGKALFSSKEGVEQQGALVKHISDKGFFVKH